MKSIYKKYCLGLFAAVAVGFTSCKDFLDVNTNPTLKGDVTIQELLPTAEFYTSEVSYNQAYITCQYSQQIGSNTAPGGLDSQEETENSTGWTNFYLNVLPQLNLVITKAQTEAAPAYVGVAKILLAYNLGIATTNWENIPFSQADQKNFAPTYDSQQSVYTNIQKLLDEAIVELQKNTGTKPSTDDIIYNGDLTKWTKLAYTLKARFAMHLSVKNPTQAAQNALLALQNGFKSNDDDFQLTYNSKNLGPWYSRVALANTTGNLSITHSATLIDLMNGKSNGVIDPRLGKIATLRRNQITYSGVSPGTGGGSSVDLTKDSWHSGLNSPLQFVTYAEAKAIEAEARFIINGGTITSKGTTTEGYNAYIEMIRSNMKKIGVSDSDISKYFTNTSIQIGATELTMSHILAEKLKAMFLIGDIWTDIRRYQYAIIPAPANLNVDLQGLRIQRMIYPASETSRNSANAKLNTKLFNEPMWMFSK